MKNRLFISVWSLWTLLLALLLGWSGDCCAMFGVGKKALQQTAGGLLKKNPGVMQSVVSTVAAQRAAQKLQKSGVDQPALVEGVQQGLFVPSEYKGIPFTKGIPPVKPEQPDWSGEKQTKEYGQEPEKVLETTLQPEKLDTQTELALKALRRELPQQQTATVPLDFLEFYYQELANDLGMEVGDVIKAVESETQGLEQLQLQRQKKISGLKEEIANLTVDLGKSRNATEFNKNRIRELEQKLQTVQEAQQKIDIKPLEAEAKKAKAELQKAQETLKKQEQQIKDLTTEVANIKQASQELTTLKEQLAQKTQEVSGAKQELQTSKERIEQIQQELKSAKKAQKAQEKKEKEEREKIARDLSKSEQENSDAQKKLEELKAAQAKLEKDLNNVQTATAEELQVLKAENAKLQQEKDAVVTEVGKVKGSLTVAQGDTLGAKQQLDTLKQSYEAEVARLKSGQGLLAEQKDKLINDQKIQQNVFAESEKSLKNQLAQAQQQVQKLTTVQANATALETKNSELQTTIEQQRGDITKLTTDLAAKATELQTTKDNYERTASLKGMEKGQLEMSLTTAQQELQEAKVANAELAEKLEDVAKEVNFYAENINNLQQEAVKQQDELGWFGETTQERLQNLAMLEQAGKNFAALEQKNLRDVQTIAELQKQADAIPKEVEARVRSELNQEFERKLAQVRQDVTQELTNTLAQQYDTQLASAKEAQNAQITQLQEADALNKTRVQELSQMLKTLEQELPQKIELAKNEGAQQASDAAKQKITELESKNSSIAQQLQELEQGYKKQLAETVEKNNLSVTELNKQLDAQKELVAEEKAKLEMTVKQAEAKNSQVAKEKEEALAKLAAQESLLTLAQAERSKAQEVTERLQQELTSAREEINLMPDKIKQAQQATETSVKDLLAKEIEQLKGIHAQELAQAKDLAKQEGFKEAEQRETEKITQLEQKYATELQVAKNAAQEAGKKLGKQEAEELFKEQRTQLEAQQQEAISTITAELDAATETNNKLQVELAKLQEENQQIGKLTEDLAQAKQQASEQQQALVTQMEQAENIAKQKIVALEQQIKDIQANVDRGQDQMQLLTAQLATETSGKKTLQETLDAAEQKIKDNNTAYQNELSSLNTQLQQEKDQQIAGRSKYQLELQQLAEQQRLALANARNDFAQQTETLKTQHAQQLAQAQEDAKAAGLQEGKASVVSEYEPKLAAVATEIAQLQEGRKGLEDTLAQEKTTKETLKHQLAETIEKNNVTVVELNKQLDAQKEFVAREQLAKQQAESLITQLKKQVDAIPDQLQAAQEAVRGPLQAELETVRQQLRENTAKSTELTDNLNALTQSIPEQLDVARNQAKQDAQVAYEKSLSDLENTYAQEKAKFEAAVKEAADNNSKVAKEKEEALAKLAAQESLLTSAQAERSEAQEMAYRLQQELTSAREELKLMPDKIKQAQQATENSLKETHASELQSKNTELADLQKKLQEASKQQQGLVTQMEQSKNSANEKITALEQQIKDVQANVDRGQDQMQLLTAQLATETSGKKTLQETLDVAEQKIKDNNTAYQKELNSLNTQLQQEKDQQIAGRSKYELDLQQAAEQQRLALENARNDFAQQTETLKTQHAQQLAKAQEDAKAAGLQEGKASVVSEYEPKLEEANRALSQREQDNIKLQEERAAMQEQIAQEKAAKDILVKQLAETAERNDATVAELTKQLKAEKQLVAQEKTKFETVNEELTQAKVQLQEKDTVLAKAEQDKNTELDALDKKHASELLTAKNIAQEAGKNIGKQEAAEVFKEQKAQLEAQQKQALEIARKAGKLEAENNANQIIEELNQGYLEKLKLAEDTAEKRAQNEYGKKVVELQMQHANELQAVKSEAENKTKELADIQQKNSEVVAQRDAATKTNEELRADLAQAQQQLQEASNKQKELVTQAEQARDADREQITKLESEKNSIAQQLQDEKKNSAQLTTQADNLVAEKQTIIEERNAARLKVEQQAEQQRLALEKAQTDFAQQLQDLNTQNAQQVAQAQQEAKTAGVQEGKASAAAEYEPKLAAVATETAQLQEGRKALEDTLAQEKAAKEVIENQLADAVAKNDVTVAELNTQLGAQKELVVQEQLAKQQAESSITQLKKQVDAIPAQLQAAQEAVRGPLQAELETVRQQLSEKTTQSAKLVEDLNALETSIPQQVEVARNDGKQGAKAEYESALSAMKNAYEQEVTQKVELAKKDVVKEVGEIAKQEIAQLKEKHVSELEGKNTELADLQKQQQDAINKIIAERDAVKTTNETLQQDLTKLREAKQTADTDLARITQAEEAANIKMTVLESEKSSLTDQLQRQEQQYKNQLAEAGKEKDAKIAETEQQLGEQLNAQKQLVAQEQQAKKMVEQAVVELQAKATIDAQTIQKFQQQIDTIPDQLQAAKNEVSTPLQAELEKIRQQLTQKTTESNQLAQEKETMEAAMKEAEGNYSQALQLAKNETGKKDQQLADLQKQNNDVLAERDAVTNTNKELLVDLAKLREENQQIGKLTQDLAQAQQQLQEASNKQKELVTQAEQARDADREQITKLESEKNSIAQQLQDEKKNSAQLTTQADNLVAEKQTIIEERNAARLKVEQQAEQQRLALEKAQTDFAQQLQDLNTQNAQQVAQAQQDAKAAGVQEGKTSAIAEYQPKLAGAAAEIAELKKNNTELTTQADRLVEEKKTVIEERNTARLGAETLQQQVAQEKANVLQEQDRYNKLSQDIDTWQKKYNAELLTKTNEALQAGIQQGKAAAEIETKKQLKNVQQSYSELLQQAQQEANAKGIKTGKAAAEQQYQPQLSASQAEKERLLKTIQDISTDLATERTAKTTASTQAEALQAEVTRQKTALKTFEDEMPNRIMSAINDARVAGQAEKAQALKTLEAVYENRIAQNDVQAKQALKAQVDALEQQQTQLFAQRVAEIEQNFAREKAQLTTAAQDAQAAYQRQLDSLQPQINQLQTDIAQTTASNQSLRTSLQTTQQARNVLADTVQRYLTDNTVKDQALRAANTQIARLHDQINQLMRQMALQPQAQQGVEPATQTATQPQLLFYPPAHTTTATQQPVTQGGEVFNPAGTIKQFPEDPTFFVPPFLPTGVVPSPQPTFVQPQPSSPWPTQPPQPSLLPPTQQGPVPQPQQGNVVPAMSAEQPFFGGPTTGQRYPEVGMPSSGQEPYSPWSAEPIAGLGTGGGAGYPTDSPFTREPSWETGMPSPYSGSPFGGDRGDEGFGGFEGGLPEWPLGDQFIEGWGTQELPVEKRLPEERFKPGTDKPVDPHQLMQQIKKQPQLPRYPGFSKGYRSLQQN